MQDRLVKWNFDEDMKEVYEPVTNTSKEVAKEVTKTVELKGEETVSEMI